MTSFIIDLHNKCAYIYYKTEVAHYDRNSGSHISGMVAQACRTGGSLEHRLFISNAKCVSYMTKYVTKELCQIALNKRRYLSSTNLDRVVKEYLNLPINQIDDFIIDSYVNDRVDYEKTQTIAEAGQQIRYITIKK